MGLQRFQVNPITLILYIAEKPLCVYLKGKRCRQERKKYAILFIISTDAEIQI